MPNYLSVHFISIIPTVLRRVSLKDLLYCNRSQNCQRIQCALITRVAPSRRLNTELPVDGSTVATLWIDRRIAQSMDREVKRNYCWEFIHLSLTHMSATNLTVQSFSISHQSISDIVTLLKVHTAQYYQLIYGWQQHFKSIDLSPNFSKGEQNG